MMREPELHAVARYLDAGGAIHWFPPGYSGLMRRMAPIARKRLKHIPHDALELVCTGRLTPSEARITRVWEVIARSGENSVRAIRAELDLAENTTRRTLEILQARGYIERVRPYSLGIYRSTTAAPPRWEDFVVSEYRETTPVFAA